MSKNGTIYLQQCNVKNHNETGQNFTGTFPKVRELMGNPNFGPLTLSVGIVHLILKLEQKSQVIHVKSPAYARRAEDVVIVRSIFFRENCRGNLYCQFLKDIVNGKLMRFKTLQQPLFAI